MLEHLGKAWPGEGPYGDRVMYSSPVDMAAISEARLDDMIEDSGAGNRKDYARRWITSIRPTDFLNMTLGIANQDRARFDNMPGLNDTPFLTSHSSTTYCACNL